MDRDLLNALQNIGDQLDILSQILSEKNETNSDVVTALISGDFSEQLKSISVEIKSIKADTQEILKTQQTILSMSKEKEKEKFGVFDESGKQESSLKKGAVVILGIAAAVLAVGTAFNLIGDVDVASVLSLTVAIGIIALSFERLSESKLTIQSVLLAGGLMVSMSLGLVISSYILSGISSVSDDKLLTSIGIAAAFGVMSIGIGSLINGIKDIKASDVPIISLGMLFIFPALSVGIVLSSLALQFVQPIGLGQLFTGILVAGLFVVLSYSIKNIMQGLEGVKPETAFTASITIPVLFTALSWAIAGSSIAIASIVPITSFSQFITALGISVLFVALSYAVKPIISVSRGIDVGDLIMIPLLFTALSVAISYSSKYLKDTEIIEFGDILKIVGLGVGLAIMVAAMALPIMLVAKIPEKDLKKGSVAIIGISVAIMLSSIILAEGDYTKVPNINWTLGSIFAISAFAIGAVGVGILVSAAPPIFFTGLGAIIPIAGVIALVSHILKQGDYNIPNILDWSIGVSLALGAFSLGMVYLGGLIVGTLGIGAGVLIAGSLAIAGVAKTIVSVSNILSEGYNDDKGVKIKPNYKPGPTKEWAEGVSIAIGAFSPIYQMLKNNAILSIFGGGGVGPKDFNEAIITVSQGIVTAANFFNTSNTKWGSYPTKQWSEGVGLAISSFAPVYKILKDNSGWFSSGINPSDFAGTFENGKLIKDGAIQIIARGIISAGEFFSKNTAPFEEGKYPSENWAKGVGGALAAFSPVYEALMNKGFFTSGKGAINNMTYGISALTNSIVATAKKFIGVKWDSYPTITWVDNVAGVIYKYVSLVDRLSKLENVKYWVATSVASRMVNFANILAKGKEVFSLTIPPDFIQNISKNVLDFDSLVKDIVKNRQNEPISFNVFSKDPIVEMADNMITLAKGYDKLASSLTNLGTSMKGLNVDSLRSLALLTNVMVNPNVTVPQIEIDKELSRVNVVTTPNVSTSTQTQSNNSMDEKLQAMIDLLIGIRSNTISLDQVMQIMSEERIKKYEID